LRTDLVLGRVECGVDDVTGRLTVQFTEEGQVTGQGAAQGVAPPDQDRAEIQKCVFSGHDVDAPRPPGSPEKALPPAVAPNNTEAIEKGSTKGKPQRPYRKNRPEES
jgi:hypothetical protein